jgi:hypothetical protein
VTVARRVAVDELAAHIAGDRGSAAPEGVHRGRGRDGDHGRDGEQARERAHVYSLAP